MKVRELLVSIKFQTDTASLAKVEQDIARVKASMSALSTSAANNTVTANSAVSDSLNKIISLIETTNDHIYNFHKGLAQGFLNVAQSLSEVKSGYTDVAVVADKAEKGTTAFNKKAKEFNKGAAETNELLNMMGYRANAALHQLIAFTGISFSVQKFISMADNWKTIKGQIKNVVADEKEAVKVQGKLYEMAARTRQGYEQAASLFTSVSRSSKELGKSTDEILAFTEDVAKAMLVGGGSAESQRAALIQLGQALGSGTLRGDELNSILEQAPVLAKTIADGMKITIGQLRQYGREGKLTAQDVFKAVRSQSDKLNKQLGNTPWTVRQALSRIQNSLLRLFGTIEEKTGIVNGLARYISYIADGIDMLTNGGEDFVNMLKLAAFWAAALFVVTNWSGIVGSISVLVGLFKVLKTGFALKGIAELAKTSRTAANFALWIRRSLALAGRLFPIIALLTAIFLMIEDIYSWFNGKDSITKRMFGSPEQVFDRISTRWVALKAEYKVAWRQVKSAFGMAAEWVVDFVGKWTPFGRIVKTIYDNWEGIAKFISIACEKFEKMTGLEIRKGFSDWWEKNIASVYFYNRQQSADYNTRLAMNNGGYLIKVDNPITNNINVATKDEPKAVADAITDIFDVNDDIFKLDVKPLIGETQLIKW